VRTLSARGPDGALEDRFVGDQISVPLSARMRRTSASESIGFSGTAMPPARMMARNQ
jgi:hypothetical protein